MKNLSIESCGTIYMRIILLLLVALMIIFLCQNHATEQTSPVNTYEATFPHTNIHVKLQGTEVTGVETVNTRQLEAEGRDIKMVLRHNRLTDVVSGNAWLKPDNTPLVSFSGVAGMVECDYIIELRPNQDYINNQVGSVLGLLVSLPSDRIRSELLAKE